MDELFSAGKSVELNLGAASPSFFSLSPTFFLFSFSASHFFLLFSAVPQKQQQLPHDATEPELSSLFSPFGAVTGVQLLKDGEGNSRGKEEVSVSLE